MPERIAVVIPCFNDGAFLRDAVRSIVEPEPTEVIIVDDGSTEPETSAVLDELEQVGDVRLVRHGANRGLAAARTTGLANTGAKYIFPIDADDRAASGAISRMADLLDSAPSARVCFGDFEEYRPDPKWYEEQMVIRAVPERLDPYRLAYANEMPATALFSRALLEQVGGWQELAYETHGFEDWDLWLTLAEMGITGIHAGNGVVFRYRVASGRMNAAAQGQYTDMYRRLRERHPTLFRSLPELRGRSSLSRSRRVLYPYVYGRRPRARFLRPVRPVLDRARVWTSRR